MTDSTIACQRALFEIPEDVCYLNCAYMSPQLREVTEVGRESVGLKAQPWRLGPEHWFDRVESARRRFGDVIGATADDVALVPSASYAIATAARNCLLGAGRRVVVIDEQFPSCVYPWRRLAREHGGEIVTVTRPAGETWTPAILEQIDERCAVVALPAFHWADGRAIDLVQIGQAARRVGAKLVLDLSQSAGACPLDLAAVDPDWLCAPTYKWLLGPYSMGFLYAAPRNHDGRPLEENWIARQGSEDFSRLVEYEDRYRDGARRYDVGERSNFALLPMVDAALERLLGWGVASVASTLRATTARLADVAAAYGFEAAPEGERAPHILGLTRPGGLPADLVARLREAAVHVGTRGDVMRVAPHVHVSEDDITRFDGALRAIA